MKAIPIIAFLALGYLSSASAITQDSQTSSDSKTTTNMPYEIVVTPNVTRGNLRELIVKVEDDFFAKFNELNLDDAFDVVCYKHTPPMTHITQRLCEPVFMIRGRGENSSETAYIFGTTSKTGGVKGRAFLLPPKAMRKELQTQYDILQSKMEEFTGSDKEFREIGSVLAQLKYRLGNYGKNN